MSPSATSSDSGSKGRPALRFLFLSLCLFLSWIRVARVEAKVLLTIGEALDLAFPGCTIERRTVYLTPDQIEQARKLADGEAPAALVHPHVASREGEVVGTAYFESHLVRTLAETVMIVVDSAGKLSRVEVLAFNEPENYLPRAGWYEQFRGRRLAPELALHRGIRGITGATLTARATTQAVRRVLAVHQVMEPARPQPARPRTAPPPPAQAAPDEKRSR